MFHVRRQQVLDECEWAPGEGQLRYIEAQSFANSTSIEDALTPDTFREGDLRDEDVQDWLHQKGRFVPPPTPFLGKKTGGIRLLVCERSEFEPLVFGLSKSSLLAIESEFDLPVEMLPLFRFHGGGYSYHFRPSASQTQTPEQLVMTIKVPQMFQVANYGLCITYSFKTKTTRGILFGWNVISDENWKKNMGRECPKYMEPHIRRISDHVKSQMPNWRHPLLLPITLLEDHIYNADNFKGFDLSPRTTRLERHLRATKAGRNANQHESLDFVTLSQNMAIDRFKIITDINTAVTDAVTFGCNMKWDSRYCQFLRDISKRLQDESEIAQGTWSELNDDIDTLATFAAAILEHTESLKARLDIQLDVLYNLVAQADSNVNSIIAATTGLDSVAMKALAFVTTLFLPPTFIATLFSMSMFDWQGDAGVQSSDSTKGDGVVSRHFGIYWAVSLPLTIIVLLSWRIWWHWEKNNYRQKYPHVKLDPDVGSNVFNKLSRMVRRRKDLKGMAPLA